jgi:hypothetical protein
VRDASEKPMAPVWHVFVAAFHWLLPHLATVGISVVVVAIGGVIMWALIFRKTQLEIAHLKVDTKRIELEVQRLTEEKIERENGKKRADLTERIVELAKTYTVANTTWGSSAPFSEQQLCSELSESPEAIAKALQTLKTQDRATYRGDRKIWIVRV